MSKKKAATNKERLKKVIFPKRHFSNVKNFQILHFVIFGARKFPKSENGRPLYVQRDRSQFAQEIVLRLLISSQ